RLERIRECSRSWRTSRRRASRGDEPSRSAGQPWGCPRSRHRSATSSLRRLRLPENRLENLLCAHGGALVDLAPGEPEHGPPVERQLTIARPVSGRLFLGSLMELVTIALDVDLEAVTQDREVQAVRPL